MPNKINNDKLQGRSRTGFTLIELLVVICLIGILVTISFPGLKNYYGYSQANLAVDLLWGELHNGLGSSRSTGKHIQLSLRGGDDFFTKTHCNSAGSCQPTETISFPGNVVIDIVGHRNIIFKPPHGEIEVRMASGAIDTLSPLDITLKNTTYAKILRLWHKSGLVELVASSP